MATKSILKNINFRNTSDVMKLVGALERAENFHHMGNEPVISRTVSDIKKEDIVFFCSTIQRNNS